MVKLAFGYFNYGDAERVVTVKIWRLERGVKYTKFGDTPNYTDVAFQYRDPSYATIWAKLKDAAISTSKTTRESGHHTLEVFKSNPTRYQPSNIDQLDLRFEDLPDGSCANCRFDVKLKAAAGPPLLEELKSYATSSWDRIKTSGPFLHQFKTYFSAPDVSSLADFAYIINKDKASLAHAKGAFRDMFILNAKAIFEARPLIFKQFVRLNSSDKIQDWEDLLELVSDNTFTINHPILSFIK